MSVPIEVELKFEISQLQIQELKEKLLNSGFELKKDRTYEKNVMYDNSAQLMQITDGRIRLRQSGDKVEFCYKKPLKDDSGIKKEIEYQVNTSDFATTEKILEMMEFTPSSSYERYRTKLHNGQVEVVLDEYPFTCFLEIEGQEEQIKKVAQLLNLDMSRNLTDPCDTLFMKWRQKQGLPVKYQMTFADYNK